MSVERPLLFECVKLFQVRESTPGTGGENPSHSFDSQSSIGIELCSWRECGGHNVLALVCNNGYIILYVLPAHGKPIIKQLKWYETRQQHILDIVLDPNGEWLVCACLDGGIYIIPVISLTLECAPRYKLGALDNVTVIQPTRKIASPTCVVWWQSMDARHFAITGSEVGEISFFDLKAKTVSTTVYISGCVDSLLLAHLADSATHLLIGQRGGEWKRLLLEEHYHEAAGISYAEVTAKDFEIVPDDAVIKTFLDHHETDSFEIKDFSIFTQMTHLTTQDWNDQHFLSSLHLSNHQLKLYSYDFELTSTPLHSYQLLPGATAAKLTDKLLFVISHNDIINPCAFTLSLMSTQRCLVRELDGHTQDLSPALVQEFPIPSPPDLVGFFGTTSPSSSLPPPSSSSLPPSSSSLPPSSLPPPPLSPSSPCPSLPPESEPSPTTHLGGCILVTKTTVYQCRQRLSPDSIFLDLALSPKKRERAEEFGITLKLDICGLYRLAAQQRLKERNFSHALKLFELSRCSAQHIINSFAELKEVPQLVQYLHQAVYDDTGHASVGNTKQAQDILFRCFLHECLRLHGTPEGSMMLDKFSQFITDKFLYDHTVAMETLLQCGLKEQLFEFAKAHNKLQEVLELMVQRGSIALSPSVQASLASRQYISTVDEFADGLYLYQMLPSTFVRFLSTKPSIIPHYLPHLNSVLPKLDVPTLIRLANLFDPSHPTIRPLLISAHSSRHRSHSTSSLMSITDSIGSGGGGGGGGGEREMGVGPRLESYIEIFLTILIILNERRRRKPGGVLRHSSLSSDGGQGSNEPYTGGSQWMRDSIVSSGLHHAAMVANGNLYTWGSTKNGKLGHGEIEDEQRSTPLRVETFLMLNVHVTSVSCGAEHTIAMCQEGIYSWGSSSHGQLGHGDTLKRSRPVQISSLADKGIVLVECGQYHSLALSDDHRVWSWGWGVHGQLGLQSVDEKLIPAHVVLLDQWNVSFIAAGYGHSAVLTAEGKVLTFGNGMYGQLGHGNTDKQSSPKPVRAVETSTIYLLACGNFHSVAVSTDQKVFHWGKNLQRVRPSASIKGLKEYKRSRQAHSAPPTSNTHTPQTFQNLELDDTAVQVSCGSFHSLLLTAKGSVYSWGSNVHGQLGHPRSAEVQQPKEIVHFEGQKVVAIAAGDEFSIIIDDRGYPWGWGRAEQGQLGFECRSSRGGPEAVKQSLFIPSVIQTLTNLQEAAQASETSLEDSPFLDIDLEWDLPDFATVGSPHIPYGRQSLDAALVQLNGFYRTSVVVWRCVDWEDWSSMATVFRQEKQWAQALECSLKALSLCGTAPATSVETIKQIFESSLQSLISDAKSYHSEDFVQKGVQLLSVLLHHWESHDLPLSELEAILIQELPVLSYPLSLLTRSTKKFSFHLQLEVAKEVIDQISRGAPRPEDLIPSTAETASLDSKPSETTDKEGLLSETRLWTEVLRNLAKDMNKLSSFTVSGPVLSCLKQDPKSFPADDTEDSSLIAFSCGHAFSQTRFESTVLPEFSERVQNFPVPIPSTLLHLHNCYKKLRRYPLACPYCVFQYLRKLQLQECPGVPIRPWNQ